MSFTVNIIVNVLVKYVMICISDERTLTYLQRQAVFDNCFISSNLNGCVVTVQTKQCQRNKITSA